MEEKFMNIMQMMQQAQDLQKKLKVAQDELAKLEVTGNAADGAVVVTCDGQGKFKSIKIKPEKSFHRRRPLDEPPRCGMLP